MSKYPRLIMLAAIVVASADSAFAQGYGGPSMLSRGGNRPGQRGTAPVELVVYGGLRGVMETGLTPVRLEADDTLASDTLYSAQAEIGAYGTHSWSKTILGLDYRGDYRKSTRHTLRGYDGTNQALSLDLEYRPTRRLMVMFRETAGTSNRAFGGFSAPAYSNLNSLGLANNEVFDTRVYFSQTSAMVSYMTSARTSWTAGGDGFVVKRPDRALVGLTGYRAMGMWNYRLNRSSTIGAAYTYMRLNYPRAFAGADMHGIALQGNKRMTRNLQLDVTAGAFIVDTFGLRTITLSPEVAALLGRGTGIEAFQVTTWVPQVETTVRYALERSTFSLTGTIGTNPGNGVYLTSRQDSVSAGYSLSGTRKLSLGLSASYSRLKSVGATIGNLNSSRAGGGINYAITRLVNFSSQIDWRTYNSPGLRGREGFMLAIGLTVSPARVPLSIW